MLDRVYTAVMWALLVLGFAGMGFVMWTAIEAAMDENPLEGWNDTNPN